jgi:hypothetical protein
VRRRCCSGGSTRAGDWGFRFFAAGRRLVSMQEEMAGARGA